MISGDVHHHSERLRFPSMSPNTLNLTFKRFGFKSEVIVLLHIAPRCVSVRVVFSFFFGRNSSLRSIATFTTVSLRPDTRFPSSWFVRRANLSQAKLSEMPVKHLISDSVCANRCECRGPRFDRRYCLPFICQAKKVKCF